MHKNEGIPTWRGIFVFWLPLFATWLMMSVEGPFLAAIIARLAEPKYNLAAYGVAFSFALIVEAPIIMIMSASTALVTNRRSYLMLRNFTNSANGIITLIMIILVLPPVFPLVAEGLIGLPPKVAHLTHLTTALLLPWPAAIGVRRFYQGLLIRNNRTRLVAYGTVIRLGGMAGTALLLYLLADLPGSVAGAISLSVGVTAEAATSYFMARRTVRDALNTVDDSDEGMTYRSIYRFYYPLAMTSILALGVHPLITFFLGQSRMPLESLAVLPVINSLVFIFRSFGLSYQEVAIAKVGKKFEGYIPVRNFAIGLGACAMAGLALIAFTPLADIWFRLLSGLTVELAHFALLPTQLLVLIPAASVLLSFQRAMLVASKRTAPITLATGLEVTTIILVLVVAVWQFDMIGAVAASIALFIGRLVANSWLTPPLLRAVRKARISPDASKEGEKNNA
ncbi:MAG: hypothetical protein C0600_08565 [Ignavibacteria bacterium]|nr:MAG: hypothetical protein C0600_08565 [Ignavibacteria bacterium]